MSSGADDGSIYSCATLRYLVDPQREITIPVGVILWSEQQNRLWFRLPLEGESVDGAPGAQVRGYLGIAREKIEGWHRLGELPYQTEQRPPLSAGWWEEVRRLLQWRVRLGSVWSLVCSDPEIEIERLYQALVRPLPAAEELATAAGSAPAAHLAG
jgi:hypothetical protein